MHHRASFIHVASIYRVSPRNFILGGGGGGGGGSSRITCGEGRIDFIITISWGGGEVGSVWGGGGEVELFGVW